MQNHSFNEFKKDLSKTLKNLPFLKKTSYMYSNEQYKPKIIHKVMSATCKLEVLFITLL